MPNQRTIVDLPPELVREVDDLARGKLKISRNEAVRRGLRLLLEKESNVSADAFGLWKPYRLTRKKLIDALRNRW